MSCIEEALAAIDTATDAVEFISKKETVDSVNSECISMLLRLVRDELALRSGILREELLRRGALS